MLQYGGNGGILGVAGGRAAARSDQMKASKPMWLACKLGTKDLASRHFIVSTAEGCSLTVPASRLRLTVLLVERSSH
jgi:hypothetical protein